MLSFVFSPLEPLLRPVAKNQTLLSRMVISSYNDSGVLPYHDEGTRTRIRVAAEALIRAMEAVGPEVSVSVHSV